MPTYYNYGDAIRGERIICQLRRINKPRTISGTYAHRALELTLADAYCVIRTPSSRV